MLAQTLGILEQGNVTVGHFGLRVGLRMDPRVGLGRGLRVGLRIGFLGLRIGFLGLRVGFLALRGQRRIGVRAARSVLKSSVASS